MVSLIALLFLSLSSGALATGPRDFDLPVTNYELAETGYVIHVRGYFQNLCQTDPEVVIKKQTFDGGVGLIELGVTAKQRLMSSTVCAQIAWGTYDIIFDLRTLDLPVNQKLTIYFNSEVGQKFKSILIPERRTQTSIHPIEQSGRIIRLSSFSREITEYRFALHITNPETGASEIVPLRTLVDLEHYIGQQVIIEGFLKSVEMRTNSRSALLNRISFAQNHSTFDTVLAVLSIRTKSILE